MDNSFVPRTPEQIRQVGLEALNCALGPTDTARFIRQYSNGSGDYTANRHKWLYDATMADIIAEAEKKDSALLMQ